MGRPGKELVDLPQQGQGSAGRGETSPRALDRQGWRESGGIIVVAEHVEFKKEPNTTSKAEEREELDEIDQEIAF